MILNSVKIQLSALWRERKHLTSALNHGFVWLVILILAYPLTLLALTHDFADTRSALPQFLPLTLMTLTLLFLCGFLCSLYMHKKELKREIKLRQTIERSLDKMSQELWEANKELEIKAEQLEASLSHQKELNEVQRSFISMASHEFRTPLAIIDNSAQRLIRKASGLAPEDIIEKARKIRIAVARMTSLMESTLNAAKMESGKMTVHPRNCNLKAILTECCQQQSELSKTHHITMEIDDLPESFYADPHALHQIFSNLLSNAVKYSPNCREIFVAGQYHEDLVTINVKDKGLGIDEDDLPKMFSRFFRAKTSIGIAGTGIGLNLIKMLVEEHRGMISVTSEKGKGSIFTVKLPARTVRDQIETTEHAA